MILKLNTIAGTLPTSNNTYKWIDYGYYIDENITSYMYYIDIDIDSNGTYDYRGVYFTQYRSYQIDKYTIIEAKQNSNNYFINTIYWFKYEPIKWKILTTNNNKAFIESILILDSQAYNNDFSSELGYYSNNYMYSTFRNWLNETFYESAFSLLEQSIIETTIIDNSVKSTGDNTNIYTCDNTNDKIFLCSVLEHYSFGRRRVCDYAKVQGLSSATWYWVRSSNNYYRDCAYVCYVNDDSTVSKKTAALVAECYVGVCPACWINL